VHINATTGQRFGWTTVTIAESTPHTDFGRIVLLQLSRAVLLRYLTIQLIRILYYLRSHLLYVVPASVVIAIGCIEYDVLTPRSVDDYWFRHSLHIFNTKLNSRYFTDHIPENILHGQTVTLLANTAEKQVTSTIEVPKDATLIISPGITLRFHKESGIQPASSPPLRLFADQPKPRPFNTGRPFRRRSSITALPVADVHSCAHVMTHYHLFRNAFTDEWPRNPLRARTARTRHRKNNEDLNPSSEHRYEVPYKNAANPISL